MCDGGEIVKDKSAVGETVHNETRERARARERDVCISEYLCIFDIRDRQTDQSQTEVKRRRER